MASIVRSLFARLVARLRALAGQIWVRSAQRLSAAVPWRHHFVLPLAAGVAALAFTAVTAPTPADAATCTAADKAAANAALVLTPAEQKAAIAAALPWGVPLGIGNPEAEELLVQHDYVTDYDADLRDPLWVAYRLDPSLLGKSPRIDCFRTDPRLTGANAATPADYAEPIFDQGHLANNSDMSRSREAVLNSFVMSNMTPQYCQFNEGVFEMTENIVRLWAKERGPLYVITGAIFDHNHDRVRDLDDAAVRMRSENGKARVAIPTAIYKILAQPEASGRIATVALVLPNDQTDLDHQAAVDYIAAHLATIATIEQETGEKFFPAFTGTIDEARALWPFTGSPGHSLVDARCRKTAGHLQ